MLTDWK